MFLSMVPCAATHGMQYVPGAKARQIATRDKAGLWNLNRTDTFRALQSRDYLTVSISLVPLEHQQWICACVSHPHAKEPSVSTRRIILRLAFEHSQLIFISQVSRNVSKPHPIRACLLRPCPFRNKCNGCDTSDVSAATTSCVVHTSRVDCAAHLIR